MKKTGLLNQPNKLKTASTILLILTIMNSCKQNESSMNHNSPYQYSPQHHYADTGGHIDSSTQSSTERDTMVIDQSLLYDSTFIKWDDCKDFNSINGSLQQQLIGSHYMNSEITPSFTTREIPQYESLEYISIPRNELCVNQEFMNSQFKIKHYRYRFHDIGPYQAYYMTDYDYLENKYYSREFKKKCQSYIAFGYLILHHPDSKSIKVLPIFYETSSDGTNQFRHSCITKSGEIKIVDYLQYDIIDDDGVTTYTTDTVAKYTVNVKENGFFRIKRADTLKN